jgi:hypothetical protein
MRLEDGELEFESALLYGRNRKLLAASAGAVGLGDDELNIMPGCYERR